MLRSASADEVWITAIYAKDGGEALERSGWLPANTSLAGVLEWASTYAIPGHDLELVTVEIHQSKPWKP